MPISESWRNQASENRVDIVRVNLPISGYVETLGRRICLGTGTVQRIDRDQRIHGGDERIAIKIESLLIKISALANAGTVGQQQPAF